MFYLYWILYFLKYFLDYEKIDGRIQIFKTSQGKHPHPQNVTVAFYVSKSIYKWLLSN